MYLPTEADVLWPFPPKIMMELVSVLKVIACWALAPGRLLEAALPREP